MCLILGSICFLALWDLTYFFIEQTFSLTFVLMSLSDFYSPTSFIQFVKDFKLLTTVCPQLWRCLDPVPACILSCRRRRLHPPSYIVVGFLCGTPVQSPGPRRRTCRSRGRFDGLTSRGRGSSSTGISKSRLFVYTSPKHLPNNTPRTPGDSTRRRLIDYG